MMWSIKSTYLLIANDDDDDDDDDDYDYDD